MSAPTPKSGLLELSLADAVRFVVYPTVSPVLWCYSCSHDHTRQQLKTGGYTWAVCNEADCDCDVLRWDERAYLRRIVERDDMFGSPQDCCQAGGRASSGETQPNPTIASDVESEIL